MSRYIDKIGIYRIDRNYVLSIKRSFTNVLQTSRRPEKRHAVYSLRATMQFSWEILRKQ